MNIDGNGAQKDCHGEFGSYDEWTRLGPQPPYRSATFVDAQGRPCVTQQDFSSGTGRRGFSREVSLGHDGGRKTSLGLGSPPRSVEDRVRTRMKPFIGPPCSFRDLVPTHCTVPIHCTVQ